MDKRAAGILMPITSLPSEYGIGCFSKSAYDFVDWLKEAGQSYWQILPLGPTSYGDSPYQSFSTYAGNPYFISLEDLIEEGVLCAGLDKFYDDGAALWQAAGKHSAVLCENFARSAPDVRLAATVNMPAHALPPWAGEVRTSHRPAV